MSRAAIIEGIGLVRRVARPLGEVPAGVAGDTAADLRRAVSDLVDRAEAHMRGGTLGTALAAAFAALAAARAGLAAVDRVRLTADREQPISAQAQVLRLAFLQMSLITMASSLQAATFRSRDEVQNTIARFNTAFGPVIDAASDLGQHETYRDLLALHAAVTRDLTQRGRPLPRMVSYTTARRLPVLALSQRLYGAADRADEIASENSVVHPLFAPAAGRVLSA